ncbi:MAG: TetR/AcrR family transcriptional regulator [Pseudomonadota bacterium]
MAGDLPKATAGGRTKSDEKSQNILSAAAKLFLEKGFERASMEAIAKEAGVSKQTVYSHFGSKEQLYQQVIYHKIQVYGLNALEDFQSDDLKNSLIAFGHHFVELVTDPEVMNMFRIVIAESTSFPKIAQLFYESGPQNTLNVLSQYLKQTLDEHQLNGHQPLQMAIAFANLLKGDMYLKSMMCLDYPRQPQDLQNHIHFAVNTFLKAFNLEHV